MNLMQNYHQSCIGTLKMAGDLNLIGNSLKNIIHYKQSV